MALAQNAPPPRRANMPDVSVPVRPSALTPEQEQEIRNWAKERMPNLHRLMTESGRPRFFNIARMRFRSVKQSGPETENLERLLKAIKNEDEVYGYMIELESAKPEDKPALKEKIRTGMRAVFDDYLAQRALRIKNLKARLDEEQRRLDEDQAQADTLVTQQLTRLGIEPGPTTRDSSDTTPPAGDRLAAPAEKK
ncbi:MAG TPA: hypothetical protein VH518_05300 [Tepidisphaeraceae bacterium]|jgi:hypothetical protein